MGDNKQIKFTELTRVQMPGVMHLTRLGYTYCGKVNDNKNSEKFDNDTNILTDIFASQFNKLNPNSNTSATEILKNIKDELDYDDLGKSFYNRLISKSPIKLIDFDNIYNNTFHCTAEFTCKRDDEEFRPDITLFVNGLPLVFIEVKKPNNKDGVVAESKRLYNSRFPNKKFRRFFNITQFMIFSNNMEYDSIGGIVPIQGCFYCSSSKTMSHFNCFREDNNTSESIAPYNKNFNYKEIDVDIEKKLLTDFHCQVISKTSEYQTNMDVNTPTNRVLTSMCNPERLLFLIKYGLAYVKYEKELEDGKIESKDEKHIMRYQQMFATMTIREKISKGIKSGVVWHTQGSGKTALSYNLTNVLTDYFASQNKVPKFYFIVDRIDLLEQSKQEFEARGLVVKTATSRKELMDQFKVHQSQDGGTGKPEITVVNIQKFAEDKSKIDLPKYATNLQRVFIIDEAHRGYNPKGSFLANLVECDENSIKIALTGTPLLKEERESWKVFGDYLHTYYYDKSILDGYTLKIIREDIETSYRDNLSKVYDVVNNEIAKDEKLEYLVQKKEVPKSVIVEHDSYVKELLKYIINDLKMFRQLHNDNSLGGMIICETSEQARKLSVFFDSIQNEINESSSYKSKFKCGLILHDSEDKETRKEIITNFKKNNTVDILIVFNMLLTGFDAPRLKRLYFGRKLKDHNLLQALTRVNRPYKDLRYGYVIDFADIKSNFNDTNEAYLNELNRFNDKNETGLNDTIDTFSQVLEDKDSLIQQMKNVRQVLFNYTLDNAEEFSSEISTIEDKEVLLELKKVLTSARDCCNLVRTFGDDELKSIFSKLEITRLPSMLSEVQHHIDNINQKEAFLTNDTTRLMINEAMMDIKFNFSKISEEEMIIIAGQESDPNAKLSNVFSMFMHNMDHDDPEYITLNEAFKQRFKEKGFSIESVAYFNEQSKYLDDIMVKLKDLQKRNKTLLKKYNDDEKFARIHKRIKEENNIREKNNVPIIIASHDEDILNFLINIKGDIDELVFNRNNILNNADYFKKLVMSEISAKLIKLKIDNNGKDRLFIQDKIVSQYINQYS
ncbi:MAG: HsdR family type I site-specific deoxyribonuclease [bacterium]